MGALGGRLEVARERGFADGLTVPELDARTIDLCDDPNRKRCVLVGSDAASLVEGRGLDKARVDRYTPAVMPPVSSAFNCPRCGESLPAGSSRCDACGAYLMGTPAAGASAPGPKQAASKVSPQGAATGNAALFLILGLIIGGAIGYVLHGAAGPRGEGGMPRGPADVMRGSAATGDDGSSGMGGGMGAGGAGGGTPPQMPPQVVAMVQEYRKALAKDPNDVEANIGFGNLLFDSSQWEKAVDHYGRALAKVPGNADVRVDRAIALHNLDRNDEALKELQRVTREQPTHKGAWLNLGVISATLGDNAGAIAAWEQYLKLDPNSEHAGAIRAQIAELKKAS